MPASTYTADGVINLVLRNTAFTSPTATYWSLHTASPGGTGANEISAGWYGRQAASFGAASSLSATNDATATWSAITGSGVTVTHIGLWDASTSGNFLWYIDVTDRAYLVSQQIKIVSGTTSLTWDTGNISTYLGNALLDHLVNNTAYTSPTTVYSALITDTQTAADGGTEVTGTGYARVATTFSAPSSGATDTAGTTDFGTVGAGGWGTLTDFSIYDAATLGNLLFFGTPSGLGAEALENDTVAIAAGSYDIALTG